MSGDNPPQGAWDTFFRSLTPDQHNLLTRLSTESSASTPQSMISAASSPVIATSSPSTVPQVMPAVARRQPATRVAGRRRETPDKKKKKPLNAFMAFRAYYSRGLPRLTQKIKSGLVRHLWAAETRKNIWALLAKAYTDLRDNHQEQVQLDKFLAATTSQVPVIPANGYFFKMGWQVTIDESGKHALHRDSNFSAAALDAEYPSQTNMSVVDLVDHCYAVRLVRCSTRIGNTAAVTFATAPAVAHPAQNYVTDMGGDRSFDLEHQLAELLCANEDVSANVSPPEFDFNNFSIEFRSDYRPTINQVTRDQQRAFERAPLASHFQPEIQPPVLGFDPNMIQDNFDPYTLVPDLGEFLNMAG